MFEGGGASPPPLLTCNINDYPHASAGLFPCQNLRGKGRVFNLKPFKDDAFIVDEGDKELHSNLH